MLYHHASTCRSLTLLLFFFQHCTEAEFNESICPESCRLNKKNGNCFFFFIIIILLLIVIIKSIIVYFQFLIIISYNGAPLILCGCHIVCITVKMSDIKNIVQVVKVTKQCE